MSTPTIKRATLGTAAVAVALLASTSIASAQDMTVNWKGAPEFSSADGNYKMKMRGRIFTDWGTVSDNSGKTVDATEFRTARLGIEGVVMKDIKYKFEVDFAGGDSDIKDGYVEWALKPVSIAVGQYKVPVSLEEQTSSRYITFMERASMTDAFGFSRDIGISANFAQNDFTFKAGVFQGNFEDGSSMQGRTYATRATYAAKIEGGLIHIGGSAFHRENDNGDVTKRYRQRPHNHLAGRYVNTDYIDSESDTFIGGEIGAILGPLSAQAEYGSMKSNATTGGTDASFSGGYVNVSYILTGESRGYKNGAFDRIKVSNPVFEGGAGAWQIAARYDMIDLTDTDAGVIGGKQTSYIAGVNWHLNNYTRVMANYSKSEIDGGANDGESIDAFGLRFQVDW
ncbi:MAG: porin [Emcibacteraceae bacterium]|nr:porin [Emcibacteraceae bacterium]MDG1857809.1 porin [Emcibacteraceae bacterium]